MIDVIAVDPRYCWEPMSGIDATMLVTEYGNGYAVLADWPDDEHLASFRLMYAFDWRGMRVMVYFRGVQDYTEAYNVIFNMIDMRNERYLISTICQMTTHEDFWHE